MNCQAHKMSNWKIAKLMKWQVDKNDMLFDRKWQIDEIGSWHNGILTNWQVDDLASK